MELQPVRQPAVRLKHNRVVSGEDVAANLRDLLEVRVRARTRVEREEPLLTVKWPAHGSERHEVCRFRQVGVHKVRETLAKAAQVGERDHRVARDLPLDDEIGLVDQRQLEVRSEVLHCAGWRRRCT